MLKPVIKQIFTNLTAFDIYCLFDNINTAFLESGDTNQINARWSIIGINPFLTLKADNARFFDDLNRVICENKVENITQLPFVGGGIGYFSYDLAWSLEKLPNTSPELIVTPKGYFNFYDNAILFDNIQKAIYITALGKIKRTDESINEIENVIMHGKCAKLGKLVESPHEFKAQFDETSYTNAIEKIRGYIKSGDVYIANMTHAFETRTKVDSLEIYSILREINPAPFSAFLRLDEFEIISSSPERFVNIIGGKVETRPIKGTRPRGENAEHDIKNKTELINSVKDKSELLMIVDLERNDLSKVCKPHSISVSELFEVEEYASVFHLVATIKGELNEDKTAVDCMKACFPGGSITGAPKIRAMEIIEELEATKRGIYTGCVGYLGFDGNADFNIAIRTIVKQGERAVFGVGGGITWESDAQAEYQETLDKAKLLFKSLNLARCNGEEE